MKKRIFLKKIACLLTVFAVMTGSFYTAAFAAADDDADDEYIDYRMPDSMPRAFKGAEGGGMWTRGAREAENEGEEIEVYHVTNLNDSGEGSFRDAVSQGNRIVVFDVSGYIDLESNVNISHDNMTILGQTAPGDGICFRSNNIKVGANEVILRYLRFRVGAHDADGNDTNAQDGLEITDDCENVIIDHCSVSWGTDENLSAYAVQNVTIQYSIIAEALNQSVHDKGEHSYAAIWGGVNLSVHHNLIATHKSRNPKIGTSETVAMTSGFTDDETLVDMKNNIIYNWGDKAGYGTENGAKTYIQNNIYRPGPATPSGKRSRIFELSAGQKYETNMIGSVYAVGNIIDVDEDDSDYALAQAVNENNWQDDLHTGVYVDTSIYSIADKTNMVITDPDEDYKIYEAMYPITLDSTEDVYDDVLENAGATLPSRDAVDERIVEQVKTRTAPTGSAGSVGLVDDPTDCIPSDDADNYDDRGYPYLAEETRSEDYDTDGDGIPDDWEDKMGLDKYNKTDGVKIGPENYTWLEIYVEEAITNPGPDDVTVEVEDIDTVYTEGETATFTAAVNQDTLTGTYIESYEDGVVTISADEDFAGGTIVAAGYDESGALVEEKSVEIAANALSAEVGTVSGDTYKVFLWNNLTDMEPLCDAFDGTRSGGTADTSEVESVEFYVNGYLVGTATDIAEDGTVSIQTSDFQTGDNDVTAKAIKSDGTYVLSAPKKMLVIGSTKDDNWTYSDGAAYDRHNFYTLTGNASITNTVTGDFKLATEIYDISSRYTGVSTGLVGSGSDGEFTLAVRYNDDYEMELYYTAPDGISMVWTTDAIDYRMLEVARVGNTISFYAGTSLADIESNLIAEFTVSSDTLTVGAAISASEDSQTVSRLNMLKLSTEQSNPTIVLEENIGQLSLPHDSVSVTVTPDGYTVGEIVAYLDGTLVTDYELEVDEPTTMDLDLDFTTAQRGTLTVYCFDENLGSGSDSQVVSVTQDPSPWALTDIGGTSSTSAAYVTVTTDYTYKIAGNGGSIGSGDTDAYTYLNQKFSGDMRMYYRSRLQDSDQFGVVIKNSLDEDLMYFFGGTQTESGRTYQLIKRSNDGTATVVADVTDTVGTSQNLYFIVEKVGDTINIYQTENGSTVYKTKTLIASVAAEGIGDEYYMGFASVTDVGVTNVPDAGWVGLESLEDNAVVWNFEYGFDWLWQIQESNVLTPSWTQDVGGRSGGIMAIEPPSDYKSDRYIFREYLPEDDMAANLSCDVLLTGDAAFNVYFQTGDADSAYKISFSDDGKIYANGSTEVGEWSTADGWYNITIETDTDTSGAEIASLTVSKDDGTAVVDNVSIEISGSDEFRSQINTEKKTDVTNGVFFEPVSGASGKYYVDNVKVYMTEPSVKVETSTSWYTFNNLTEASGTFTINGTTELNGSELSGTSMSVTSNTLATGSWTINGYSFTNRIRIKGTSQTLVVPVEDGATVYVYAASASSSSTRTLYIDGVEYPQLSRAESVYSYSGSGDSIVIYAGDNIDIYGVRVEKTTVVE